MTRHADHDDGMYPPLLIGPNADRSSDLLDAARAEARREEDDAKAGQRVARRLFVGFILVALVGVLFFIVVPHYGLYLPPVVPILTFLAIAVGTILSFTSDQAAHRQAEDEDGRDTRACKDDEGRPIGCCPGPRPLRMFRD